jgi:hypothetical protein
VHQQDRVPAEVGPADELGQLAEGIDVGEHGRTVAAAGRAAGGQLPLFFRGNRPPSGHSM